MNILSSGRLRGINYYYYQLPDEYLVVGAAARQLCWRVVDVINLVSWGGKFQNWLPLAK
jgi:hypothetical protein